MKKILAVYLDRRMLFIFINGVASGFPWVVIGSALSAWLKDLGLSRTAIGFFGLVFAVYALNWLWAPLVDRVRLPLCARLGQRRAWLLLTQVVLLAFIAALAWLGPETNLVFFSLLALGVATASATQDIVIDAYRIDIINADETGKMPAAAALATAGWWAGFGYLGALPFFLADTAVAWRGAYWALAGCMLIFIANTLLLREPATERAAVQAAAQAQYEKMLGGRDLARRAGAWILTSVVEPLKDFLTRFGHIAVLLLLFIVFFKVGEAFLGRMSIVFYKEIGFTNAQIATYSKLAGTTATIAFSILASFLSIHYGLIRGLLIGGVAMAASNLIFAYMAHVGPEPSVFAAAILVDNFTSAFSTVAFVAFISHLTNRAYTATQYALMASAGNFGRTVFAGGSGWLVDSLAGDWIVFFVITSLMVIPSLLLLYWIGKKLRYLFE